MFARAVKTRDRTEQAKFSWIIRVHIRTIPRLCAVPAITIQLWKTQTRFKCLQFKRFIYYDNQCQLVSVAQ